jgi:hypothetical protein
VIAAAAAGILAGTVLALSFWLFMDRAAVRTLRRKLWAHVLELRLFGDDPVLAFGSLVRISKTNALLLAHALPPLAIAAPVLVLLTVPLTDFFTRTPLQTGGDAVLTVRLRRVGDGPPPGELRHVGDVAPTVGMHAAADGALPGARPAADALPSVELQTPPWIEVDAPPVHVPAAHEIAWRLRATAPKLGLCRISVAGETVTKELDARPAPRYSSTVRSTAWADALLHPAEGRLPAGPVERIWISPVPAPLRFAGVTMEWWEWLAAIAGLTAWLLSIPLARLGRPRLFHFLFHRL